MFSSLLLLPAWIKTAIVGGLIIAAMQVQHMIQMHGLHKEIASLSAELDKEKLANAELRQGLVETQANKDKLQATIVSQNAAISLWQSRATAAEAKAATKAVRIIHDGAAAAAVLRNTTGAIGPEGLNTWLTARFASH